jgi:hypothetical protein
LRSRLPQPPSWRRRSAKTTEGKSPSSPLPQSLRRRLLAPPTLVITLVVLRVVVFCASTMVRWYIPSTPARRVSCPLPPTRFKPQSELSETLRKRSKKTWQFGGEKSILVVRWFMYFIEMYRPIFSRLLGRRFFKQPLQCDRPCKSPTYFNVFWSLPQF